MRARIAASVSRSATVTGDSAIAGTKIRILYSKPGAYELVLRTDFEAGLHSGAIKVLSEADDMSQCEVPMDVLRSDRVVVGTLYSEINWPFAGARVACRGVTCRGVTCRNVAL